MSMQEFVAEKTRSLLNKGSKMITMDNSYNSELMLDKNRKKEAKFYREQLIKVNLQLNNMKKFVKSSEAMLKAQNVNNETLEKLMNAANNDENSATQEAILNKEAITKDQANSLIEELESVTMMMDDLGVTFESSAKDLFSTVQSTLKDNRLAEDTKKDTLDQYLKAIETEMTNAGMEDKEMKALIKELDYYTEAGVNLDPETDNRLSELLKSMDDVLARMQTDNTDIKIKGTLENINGRLKTQTLTLDELNDLLDKDTSKDKFKADFLKNPSTFSTSGNMGDLLGAAIGIPGLGQAMGAVGIIKDGLMGLGGALKSVAPLVAKAALVFGAFKLGEWLGEQVNKIEAVQKGSQWLFDKGAKLIGADHSLEDDEAMQMAEEAKSRGVDVMQIQRERQGNSLYGKAKKKFGSWWDKAADSVDPIVGGAKEATGAITGMYGTETEQVESKAKIKKFTNKVSSSIKDKFKGEDPTDMTQMLSTGGTNSISNTKLPDSKMQTIVVPAPNVNVTVPPVREKASSNRHAAINDMELSIINMGR